MPIILQPPTDCISDVSQNAIFNFVVKKSHIPVKVEVQKSDKLLKIDSQKYVISHNDSDNSFEFSTTNCSVEDAGLYNFVISNIFGKITSSARLQIRCNIFLSLYLLFYYFYLFNLFF